MDVYGRNRDHLATSGKPRTYFCNLYLDKSTTAPPFIRWEIWRFLPKPFWISMNELLSIDDSGKFGDKTSQKIIVIIELTHTYSRIQIRCRRVGLGQDEGSIV
jgi:hypothetical protein